MTAKTKQQKDSYQTPVEFFDYYNYQHQITIDLFASKDNALAAEFYTLENSFFDASPADLTDYVCWANPPYSNPKKYIKSLVELFNATRCKIIVLLPVDFSTEWFGLVLNNATEINYIVGGRIPFVNPVTGKGEKIMRGNLVAIFDPAHKNSPQVTRYIDIKDIYSFVGKEYKPARGK